MWTVFCAVVVSLVASPPQPFNPVPLRRADPAEAAPFVKLPAEIKAEPGEFVAIKPETNGKEVQYHSIDPGLSLFPSGMLSDLRNTVVVPKQPGRYRLLAYTAAKDKASPPAIVTIVAGNAPPVPVPVPPGPDPGPGPAPVPPAPVAGFAAECQAKMVELKATRDDLLVVHQALKRNLADPVNHPVVMGKVLGIMRANNLPNTVWTPYTEWMAARMTALYEADGTMATTAEVIEAMKAWQQATEALLK
jgi:hypothetical protein